MGMDWGKMENTTDLQVKKKMFLKQFYTFQNG